MNSISDESFNQLVDSVERFLTLSVKFKIKLKTLLYETTYKKDSRILNFNETQHTAWFLLKGLAREIRVNKQTYGEKTTWFWFESNFMYTTPGFFSQVPSESTIQVIDDCSVVCIDYEDWLLLKSTFKETDVITEKVRAANERIRLEHSDDIKHMSTADRYFKYHSVLQKLFSRTKLRYIADFLGMSSDTMGRLRKRY